MKKYILEFKGTRLDKEFCEYASDYFENFIEDNSKRTMSLMLNHKTQMSVRVLDTGSGEYNEIPEIRQIQNNGKITLAKPGIFRRVMSYFI